jgi:hypothetical protein
LTKQGSANSHPARQGSETVTPDMIDAGVEQFLRDYPETGTGDALDRRMVGRIYEAMRIASVGIAGKAAAVNQAA